MTEIIHQLA